MVDPACTNGSRPLSLQGLAPFGVGGRRLCFEHPLEPAKCVKVLRQDQRRTVRSRRHPLIPARFRRWYDNNAHEQRVLARLWARIGDDAGACLPRCYGMVATDQGPGLVLDLIRDHDGRISRSLRELISTGHDPKVFREAFEHLGQQLVRHRVVTRKLLDHNIVAQDRGDGTWRLYLIDGLGDPAWIPVTRWIGPLARARIIRRLAEAWERIEQSRDHPVTRQMIEKSNWGEGFLNHRGQVHQDQDSTRASISADGSPRSNTRSV